MKLHVIPSVGPAREENRRASTDSELFRFAVALSETLLPPGYTAYRKQVERWREKVHDSNIAIVESVKAKEKADELLADACEIEEQLLAIEHEHPTWKRSP